MIQVERWQVAYEDGDVELFEDEVLARSAHQLATGSQLRQRLIEVPGVYRLWDPAAKQWVGQDFYQTVDKAAGDKLKFAGSQVRLVPEPSVDWVSASV